MLTFYATCGIFVFVILGAIAWAAGFNIISFLLYIKEEVLLVLATQFFGVGPAHPDGEA